MNARLRITILLLLLLHLSAHAYLHPGSITHLGTFSGLSNGYVVSVTQDADGYIWLATEDGLNRFDGRRFVNYTRNNSGLTANELNCVAFSPDYPDRLFIATQRDGVCVYDRRSGKIEPLPHKSAFSQSVTSIKPASSGKLWFSHYHNGIELYDPKTETGVLYAPETVKGLPRRCWTMAEGDNGKIYIGHSLDGFSVLDTASGKFENYKHIPDKPSLPGNEVYCISVDSSGYVWLGTDAGAAVYNPATGTITPFVHGGPGTIGAGRVKGIRHMNNGEIWFATSQGGVSVLDVKSFAFSGINGARFSSLPVSSAPNGISGVYSTCIFPDSFGNIWIGNYRNGVDMISHLNPVFTRLDNGNGNHGSQLLTPVWGCVKGKDGSVWFGGENEIIRWSGDSRQVFTLPVGEKDNKTFVNTMGIDKEGRIWVGTNERGAFVFDHGKFSKITDVPRNVRGFYETDGGEMWICTNNGIYASDGLTALPVDHINSLLPDEVVEVICADRFGNLWVGTFGKGVTVFGNDNKVLATLNMAGGFPSNAINAIRLDSRDRIWIATRNGAVMVPDTKRMNEYVTFPAFEEIGVTYVKALEEAPDSTIWMATNKGIVHMLGNDNVSLYPPTMGMPLESFIGNGSVTDDEGNIFFTSVNGAFRVSSDNVISPESGNALVDVSNFTIYKEGRDSRENEYSLPITSQNISLNHDQNTFKITFCILDPALTDHYDLSYNMKGLDNVWMEAMEDNNAMYRNLPPGRYRFQVRQRLKGHDWSNPQTILTIEIAPPFWASWWAKTIYALILIAVIVVCALYYKKRVKLKQQLDAEVQNNLNRQKLNEERLRFYTNITHELRTPLTLILGPLEDMVSDPSMPQKHSFKLQIIRDSSVSLLNMINGILEFRKTETQNRQLAVRRGNLGNLLREIGLRYKELNRNPDVEMHLDIENDSENIYFDPDIITTIVNNLLSNAVKYTPTGKIVLSYHTLTENGERRSVIKVTDTGYGIPKEGLSHIFERYYQVSGSHQASGTGIGLALVKSLAEIHHATIEVESKENVGSEFTLTLLTDSIYPEALHRDTRTTPSDKTAETPSPSTDEGAAEPVHIVVVEDNYDIREYISQALSSEFKVTTATNGLEGLKVIHDENPDIVISDIMMPEMDGIDLCRTLKDDIMTSHIPVILLTAKDSIDDKEQGYESGADSYLTKPFSAKLLLSRIHNILRHRRQISSRIMQNLKDSPMGHSHSVTDITDTKPTQQMEENTNENASQMEQIKLSDLDREFIEKFTSIIRDNLAVKDLGVAFIADKMCMSLSALYRKVTTLLGISTTDYISKVRLSCAAEMIVKGEKSVTEIAYLTGFSGHSTLARAFKREYGMTATEYAAKARTKE